MIGWQRTYAAVCAGVVAFTLAYVAVDYVKIPRAVYDPIGRRWLMGRPQGLAMGYVGQWAWAWIAGGVIFVACWLALGARRRPIGDRMLGLGLAWTITAILLAVGYTTWNNFP